MATVRTNLGPLTTPFTYPESCRVIVQGCSACYWGWQGQTCSDNDLNTQGVQDNVECWPDRTGSVTQTNKELRGWGYYSPGISCPAGYEKRCSATGTADVSGFTFQFPLLEGETGIGCCPTYVVSYVRGSGLTRMQPVVTHVNSTGMPITHTHATVLPLQDRSQQYFVPQARATALDISNYQRPPS